MKTGITFSCFDLLHSGHVQMLREAKEQCDYLVVGLQTDPTIDRPEKNKPIQSVVERYVQLSAVKYVDEIIPYETEEDVKNILKLFVPHVRIIGEDYRFKDFTGKELCRELGVEIFYNSRKHDFSTSGLRKNVSGNS
jgi:glycerol-3-phosphate cytidylyltransferase